MTKELKSLRSELRCGYTASFVKGECRNTEPVLLLIGHTLGQLIGRSAAVNASYMMP